MDVGVGHRGGGGGGGGGGWNRSRCKPPPSYLSKIRVGGGGDGGGAPEGERFRHFRTIWYAAQVA